MLALLLYNRHGLISSGHKSHYGVLFFLIGLKGEILVISLEAEAWSQILTQRPNRDYIKG